MGLLGIQFKFLAVFITFHYPCVILKFNFIRLLCYSDSSKLWSSKESSRSITGRGSLFAGGHKGRRGQWSRYFSWWFGSRSGLGKHSSIRVPD